MSVIRTLRLGLAAAIGALALACRSDTTAPPIAGVLAASLVSPVTDDGAVLVRVVGPGIEGVQSAASSYVVCWRQVSATDATVMVLGNLDRGPLFTVAVPDVHRSGEYRTLVLDVADRADASRSSTDGYAVSLDAATATGH